MGVAFASLSPHWPQQPNVGQQDTECRRRSPSDICILCNVGIDNCKNVIQSKHYLQVSNKMLLKLEYDYELLDETSSKQSSM